MIDIQIKKRIKIMLILYTIVFMMVQIIKGQLICIDSISLASGSNILG
jgi:hypothetical protein